MRIGELARRTGVSVRSIRYYEEQQLLLGGRTGGGQRVYDDDAVARVELIQLFFAAGLTSEGVRQMLPCVYSGTVTPQMLVMLQRERARIDAQLRDLAATVTRLDDVIAQAHERLATPAAS